ncbi:DoxX family membrane protein [Halobacteriaceae archaeon GCM10025711]
MLILRLLTGWWMLHAGLTKVMEGGFDATGYLMFASQGTILAPIEVWFAQNAPAFVNFMIPWGELLIGLGLLLGAFVRLAAFFGAFLMMFFYFTNADWAHGMFSGDMMGMMLIITLAVFGAGRVWGLDQYLEKMDWAKNSRWAAYILG